MSTIISGRFESAAEADAAVAKLTAKSIARDAISVVYVSPPGQHDATSLGGDEHHSRGTENAAHGAQSGALMGAGGLGVAGVIVAATAGLAAPLVAFAGAAAAATGAYAGSLGGAMSGTIDAGPRSIRHAGMLVSVHAPEAQVESDAITVLREAGAFDLERADGMWSDGLWDDFDPTMQPKLVDPEHTRER